MAFTINASAQDIAAPGPGGGMFSDLPVPIDLIVMVDEIEEYDNTHEGRTKGWHWWLKTTDNEAHNDMRFRWTCPETERAMFKMVEILQAIAYEFPEGYEENGINSLQLDAEMFGGELMMARIDYPWKWKRAKLNGTSYDGPLNLSGVAFKEPVALWKIADNIDAPPQMGDPSDFEGIDLDSPLPVANEAAPF